MPTLWAGVIRNVLFLVKRRKLTLRIFLNQIGMTLTRPSRRQNERAPEFLTRSPASLRPLVHDRPRFGWLTGDDVELQRELVTSFLEQAPRIARELAGPLPPERLREVLHLLKGSCLCIAAERLSREVAAAEHMQSVSPAGLDGALLLATVKTTLAETIAQLQDFLAGLPSHG